MFEVSARYLKRLAVVYIRQSTERQVRFNQGSRKHQEGQLDHALRFGWRRDDVVVIDCDLGQSGLNLKRRGYRQMLDMIESDKVGAVFISEVSRAGRDDIAWLTFLGLLAERDVLLFENGVPTDPNDDDQMYQKKMQALNVFRENKMRTTNLHGGRIAKARAGSAVSAPPAGYIPLFETREGIPVKTGLWAKDPDVAVRSAVESVFRAFREGRSLPRAVSQLIAWGVRLPGRRGLSVPFTYAAPTVARVRRFVTEITYAGVYVYARQHRRRVLAGGEPVPPHRPIGQFVELVDHHEAYITREEFRENQRTLATNRRGPGHSQLGRGRALLQGVCRCGRHRTSMTVYYGTRVRSIHWGLRCPGDSLRGGPACVTIPGAPVEEAVVKALLATLAPSAVDEARRLWTQERKDWARQHAGVASQIETQKGKIARLRRRIVEDDGTHPNVRAMLNDEYEQAARELDVLTDRARRQDEERDPFTEQRWKELSSLCADREAIWRAPTTTNHDRKQLMRILIRQLVVEYVDAERLTLAIEWADGSPSTALELLRPAHYRRLMWEWHVAGGTPEDAVLKLRALGGRTQQGRLFSLETVRKTLRERAARARERRDDGCDQVPPVTRQPWPTMLELHARGLSSAEIAHQLNTVGLLTRYRGQWSPASVQRVLRRKELEKAL